MFGELLLIFLFCKITYFSFFEQIFNTLILFYRVFISFVYPERFAYVLHAVYAQIGWAIAIYEYSSVQ